MDKKKEDELLKLIDGMDVSEVLRVVERGNNRYNRRILRFFRWFCKWVPVGIMLTHWVAMYDFAQNHYDMFEPYDDNWVSYIFTYFMLYILPMVIILASKFFWLCWRYRIPFFYFFGVNAIHIGYGNWYTTNEMVMPHLCLAIMIVSFYLYGFCEIFVNNSRLGRKFFS